jgi:hypothetical protein
MIDIELDGGTVRIPEFAMDKSIQTLIQLAKQQGFKTNEIEKADKRTATVLSRMEKVLTAQAKSVEQQTKEEKAQTKQQRKETQSAEKVRKAIDDSTKSNSEKLEKLAEKIGDKNAGGMLGGVVGKLGIFSKFLSIGAAAVGGFITAVTTAFKFLMRLGKLEGGLFRSGFFNFASTDGVASGIASLGMQATRAGMTMEQAAEFTMQFSKAMDAFGTQSIFAAAQSTQALLREQGYLALSLGEISTIVGEQADVFARAGLQVGNNGQKLAQHSVEIARTTQAFSELTKTSAEVIRQLVIQASSSNTFLNRLNMLPESIRQSTLQSAQTAFAGLAAFGEEAGGSLATMLSEGIGFGDLGFSESFRELTVSSPQLADALRGLNNAVIGNGNVTDSLDTFRKTVLNVSDTERQRLQSLAIMGDGMAQTVLTLINQQALISDETNSFIKMMKEANTMEPGKLAEAQTLLSNAMTMLSAQFQKLALAFLTESNVQAFNSIIDAVTRMVADLSKDGGIFSQISGFITNSMNKVTDFTAKIKDMFNNLVDSITNALTNGVSAGIARGVALALPGGDTAKTLKTYDALVDAYRNAQDPDQKNAALVALLQGTGKSGKNQYAMDTERYKADQEAGTLKDIRSYMTPLIGRNGQQRPMTEAEIEAFVQGKIGEYYSGSITGYKAPGAVADESGQTNDTTGTQQSDGMGGSYRSKIRIMPMFGDAQSFIEQGEMTEAEYRRRHIEILQSTLDALRNVDKNTGNNATTSRNQLELISNQQG